MMIIDKILVFFGVESPMTLLIKGGISAGIYLLFHFLSISLIKILPTMGNRFIKVKNEKFKKSMVEIIDKPFSVFIKILGIFLAVTSFPLNLTASVVLDGIARKLLRVSTLVLVSIAAQNFVISIPEIFDFSEEKHGISRTLIVFFTKLGKTLIIVFSAVIIIGEFGYDVTGLITGLGLSGLTFALAAQDIASNFMSGVTILVDKTFGVGDWIKVGGIEGIVEEINFRSCRIRTFDNALITVPNSKISNDSITNWTKMNLRKTNIIIGLVYSTTKETLQKVSEEIYTELSKLEEIKTDSLLVKFDNFSASSLDIKISYNSYPIPGPLHLALKEKVQYIIMDIVEKNNTDFAFNTVTVVSE